MAATNAPTIEYRSAGVRLRKVGLEVGEGFGDGLGEGGGFGDGLKIAARLYDVIT